MLEQRKHNPEYCCGPAGLQSDTPGLNNDGVEWTRATVISVHYKHCCSIWLYCVPLCRSTAKALTWFIIGVILCQFYYIFLCWQSTLFYFFAIHCDYLHCTLYRAFYFLLLRPKGTFHLKSLICDSSMWRNLPSVLHISLCSWVTHSLPLY